MRVHEETVRMAAEFQQQIQVLAQALERSAKIQEGNVTAHVALIQTLQTSSPPSTASGEKRSDSKPLPQHYVYSASSTESFNDHLERLKCIKGLQTLNEDEFIKLFKSSLAEQALRVLSAINENDFLGKLYGSREYIESLEKLFVSAQQNRTFRPDFANLTQKRNESILEFYANLLYLPKTAKLTNVNNNVACKEKFIDSLRNIQIKRKLLGQEVDNESLQAPMTRAANLESMN